VLSTVVSHPATSRITCDAGHKTVSADSGVPTCAVIGHAGLIPARPSEEHLPIDVTQAASIPGIGETVYLVPRHVCPTVNNFDHAIIVEGPLPWNWSCARACQQGAGRDLVTWPRLPAGFPVPCDGLMTFVVAGEPSRWVKPASA
jgi:hypothetical protein